MSCDENKIKEQNKVIDLLNNFTNSIPEEKIKYDDFGMIAELTNIKLNHIQIKEYFNHKLENIDLKNIKTKKEI